MVTPEEVLSFWLDETGPDGWYNGGDALDAEIKRRFEPAWDAAMAGQYGMWLTYPSGTLAYIILLDQFSRNMFRGTAKAFASDRFALAVAKQAIGKKWDMKIAEPARQFFYMPLMHSENLADQERCIRMMMARMPESGANNLLHARVHREIIRMFGRFPYRNDALSRGVSEGERDFLDNGGYGRTLEGLRAAC